MKDIFKKAKFGNVFVCKNGWRLLFVTKDEEKALLLKQGPPKDRLYDYNLSGKMIFDFDGGDAEDDGTEIKFEAIPLLTLKVKKPSI